MVTASFGNFPAAQVLHLIMTGAELAAFDATTIATLRAVTWAQDGLQYRLVQGFAFLLEIEVVG